MATSRILHGLNWRQTRFLWRPLCVSQKHAAVIGTAHCVPAECGLSLCVHVYCAEDTASRFQPLTHCHNYESRKKKTKKNTQSSGREASASAFVWIELSITGADRIKSYKGAVLKYTFSSPNEICQSCLSEEDLHTKLMQFTFAAEIQAQQRDSQCWLGSF